MGHFVIKSLTESLSNLQYLGIGSVSGLIEKPGPGVHAARTSVLVEAGQGFTGDHNRKDFWRGERISGREVTMFSAEVAQALGADPLNVGDNVISTGMDLSKLKAGSMIRIGEVLLRRSEKDHRPCDLFARRVSVEAMQAVRDSGTRGALFYVIHGGTMTVGDSIVVEQPEE